MGWPEDWCRYGEELTEKKGEKKDAEAGDKHIQPPTPSGVPALQDGACELA